MSGLLEKTFTKLSTLFHLMQVAQPAEKFCKGSAATGAPVVKLLKPKSTNPKPFRLRTDVICFLMNQPVYIYFYQKHLFTINSGFQERGILREANLERKNHAIAPQKEVAATTKLNSGDTHGHDDDIQVSSLLS